MAGPLGFFKGLQARVLYSMPATAICWSTYEFFKFILSAQNHENYRSTVSHSGYSSGDNNKKRILNDDALKQKRYVIAAENSSLHHNSNPNSIGSDTPTPAKALLPIARELSTTIPSSGAYNTLSLKSMHSDHLYDPIGRGCNR